MYGVVGVVEYTKLRSGVTRALIGGGGGGCIFIYSCSARRISFEIKFIQKKSVGQNTNI